MDRIEVAKIKPGQNLTLEFGEREAVLTKLDEPKKFKVEDWFPEEREFYILDEAIVEDEPLHYSMEPVSLSLEEALAEDRKNFGLNKKIRDFFGRPVGGIEMDEEEDEGEEDADAAAEKSA
ncbi:MAG: hypothetical protein HQL63_06385 [Magnetococcales bacterium]|nr:hypothetical protein [Magnetococcales bacterium]MBF0322984.1 hypothetical protein [Magnetococcales bacterium]